MSNWYGEVRLRLADKYSGDGQIHMFLRWIDTSENGGVRSRLADKYSGDDLAQPGRSKLLQAQIVPSSTSPLHNCSYSCQLVMSFWDSLVIFQISNFVLRIYGHAEIKTKSENSQNMALLSKKEKKRH